MHDFSGRVLLLTGACGGIGRAIAELFRKCGAQLLIADKDQASVQALAHTLDPEGSSVAHVAYDAGKAADATTLVELCMRRFGRLDFLIPAAAIYEEAPFAEMTDEQWERTLGINLNGVFYVCRRAVPVMSDGGSIVLIASDAGHQGATPGHAHYGASKGGVLGLSRSLARELAPRIRVNAISPGAIDTPMIRDVMARWGKAIIAGTPLERLGTPHEVATVAGFLCSQDAAFFTGQSLHPNGGAYIPG